MTLEIRKGFVANFDNGSDAYNNLDFSMVSFTVGDPPAPFWSPFSFGQRPFANGDYVAVAGKRSIVPGVGRVALSYRRLGTSGAAHMLNIGFPLSCMLLGSTGIFGILIFGSLSGGMRLFTAFVIAIGLFGVWRLGSMYMACRMLDKMEAPLATYT